MYKGFIEEESNIYVVYEYFENEITLLPNIQWCILDEILYKTKSNDIFIQSNIINSFNKNKCLTEIIDQAKNKPFSFPFLLYFITNNKNRMINETILDETLFLMPFGDWYYFSSDIIHNNDNNNNNNNNKYNDNK